MSRSIQRSMLRRQYEKFCEAWKNEKMYQKITLDSGKELPEGMQKLGHKPTFKMWTQALKNQKLAASLAPSEKAVEVKDTSWEE